MGSIPVEYAAVPISADQAGAALSICALVRRQPEPAAGRLVVLRDLIDGRVLLGCLLDAGGVVQDWLELWIQDAQGLSETAPAFRETLTNAVLDTRWRKGFAAMSQADPASIIRTGAEELNPLPTYIDALSMSPVHPTEAQSGGTWELCGDDSLLKERSLPTYTGSLHRYLYVPSQGAQSPLARVSPDAPDGEGVLSAAEVTCDCDDLLPLNPGGGLMMVRRHSPIGFEAFADLLAGASFDGVFHGRSILDAGPAGEALRTGMPDKTDDGWLLLGPQGRAGRVVEALHLKLRLLADAAKAARDITAATQRPMLNLSAESFQVRLAPPGAGLPLLWTARAAACQPGAAVTLPIRTSTTQYFLAPSRGAASVYQPSLASGAAAGRCSVRIRQVLPEAGSLTIVEGTLATQERFEAARYDLAWMRLNLAAGRVDLYGQIEQTTALAAGEWRFRTVGQKLDAKSVAALRAAEGVPLNDSPFEIIPLLSTPCDLYSLAVLAVRTLLVDDQTTLPVALDETLSLARQAAAAEDLQAPLAQRIRQLFESDGRWAASVGPQRLVRQDLTPAEAMDLVPLEVWFDVLAAIVRLFPGVGPDSIARDYGDAPPGGIHKVFQPFIDAVSDLLIRTRSLIVIDWRYNREVHAVVRKCLMGLGTEA